MDQVFIHAKLTMWWQENKHLAFSNLLKRAQSLKIGGTSKNFKELAIALQKSNQNNSQFKFSRVNFESEYFAYQYACWNLLISDNVLVKSIKSVELTSTSQIHNNTKIDNNCQIINSIIGENNTIYCGAVVKNSKLNSNVSIGNYAIINNTTIGSNSTIGHSCEITRSSLGKQNIFGHYNYVGDTVTGENVSFGAGTVVANSFFKQKNTLEIGNNVYIGCNCVIVSPLKIGNNNLIGAGTRIVKNVGNNQKLKEKFMMIKDKNE